MTVIPGVRRSGRGMRIPSKVSFAVVILTVSPGLGMMESGRERVYKNVDSQNSIKHINKRNHCADGVKL